MKIVEFTVPGDPVVKGRPRATRGGNLYTPARTKQAEEVVGYAARAAMTKAGYTGPVLGPVGLAVEFYCQTNRRADGDNLLKLVSDAMNEIVYADDQQIEEWFARVHRGVGREAARTELYLYRPLTQPLTQARELQQ